MQLLIEQEVYYFRNRKVPTDTKEKTPESLFEEYGFKFSPKRELNIVTPALKKVYEDYKELVKREGKDALFGEKQLPKVVKTIVDN